MSDDIGNIRVGVARSEIEGGCCGCHRHSTPDGTAGHKVYVIDFGHTIVRVCSDCRQELIHALANANRTVIRKRR